MYAASEPHRSLERRRRQDRNILTLRSQRNRRATRKRHASQVQTSHRSQPSKDTWPEQSISATIRQAANLSS